MKINLHIERLVLDGVNIEPSQHHLLQTGIETELARKLTEGGLSHSFKQDVALPKINAANIQIPDAGDGKPISRQIAQSVYGGIGHE